ncbi:glycosyltransferase family 2 protein [Ancylobacter sp. TS-1]|uniref:glycosyltransferase family 2 protein n=1 Tax=Ancylobacter sp. TS-1 TaxID=1850374 RepID=UPI001265BA1E|nr:glycosyltransferase family 2 protein [Ancylobacter sp. TS-1]QFR32046.1 glycosyltransferase [Ancylobacter sp. TS-1]
MTKEDIARIEQTGLFDAHWYVRQRPGLVREAGRRPLRHYLRTGWREGLQPSPFFDGTHYLAAHADVAAAGCNPLLHYALWGRDEGRTIRAEETCDAAADVAFSVILPTFDRMPILDDCLRLLLAQTHRNFEVIVVDDGSTDGTGDWLHRHYAAELAQGRMVYLRLSENFGVAAARNAGLLMARHPWIAYADSDNLPSPGLLDAFARRIVFHGAARTLYARFLRESDALIIGRRFDLAELRRENFVDLGVFVHHIDCFRELGGFDVSLRRLVDWDLVLKYLHRHPPLFIDEVLLTYREDPRGGRARISDTEAVLSPKTRILRRYGGRKTVTSLIVCYNQADFIAGAIESVAFQRGDFQHEVVIADDGSTDGTAEIALSYCEKWPWLIRLIGDGVNRGIAGNYRRAFAAASGDYVAILEGDDFWHDRQKLARQSGFLDANPDCPMVFSRIEIEAAGNPKRQTLERQNRLRKDRLDGADFLAEPTLNLIANLSCCMFRTDLMKTLPSVLYRHRLSEIGLAFHLERIGPLGYMRRPMSVYRQHAEGVWSGASAESRRASGRLVREIAKAVAHERYKPALQAIIDRDFAPTPPA